MVTRPAADRREMRQRAIRDYLRQDDVNRELVMVIDRGDEAERAAILRMAKELDRGDVRAFMADGAPTLGALRNLAVAEARGDLICQWDDDDLHHPGRLTAQRRALDESSLPATILAEVMMLDSAARRLVWTNWANTPAGGHPATLLCRRDAIPDYPEDGLSAQRGEDLAVILALKGRGRLVTQAGAPHLYVYVAHGSNTCPDEHQAMLMETLAISKGLLSRRERFLRDGLAPFDVLGAVAVEGVNGPAFRL